MTAMQATMVMAKRAVLEVGEAVGADSVCDEAGAGAAAGTDGLLTIAVAI
jgi:hypothetical protein